MHVRGHGGGVHRDSVRFEADGEDLRFRNHPAIVFARSLWSGRFPEAFTHVGLAADPQIDSWDVNVRLLDTAGAQHVAVVRAEPAHRFRGPEIVDLEPPEDEPAPGFLTAVVPVAFRGWTVPVSYVRYVGEARHRIQSVAGEEVALPPGDYEVRLHESGWFGPLFANGKQRVTVESGERQQVEFEASEVPRHLRMRVEIPAGHELPGVRLVARRRDDGFALVFSGQLSQPFDMYLPAGEFELEVATERYGFDYVELIVPGEGEGPTPEPVLRLEPVDDTLGGYRPRQR